MRGIRPLLVATGVSVAGDGALNTAAPLLAAALTSDPVAVSVVTAAAYVPWLIVSLPAGALVDRWPKRPLMMWVTMLQIVVLGLFCGVLAIGHGVLVALVIAVLLVNAAETFYSPAAQNMIPAIVGRDEQTLRRINGKFVTLDGIGRALVGPFAGAWLFTVGRILPFLADVLSFVVAAIFLGRLPTVPPMDGPHETIGVAIRTGFRQLYQIRELFVLAVSTGLYNVGYFAAIGILALYTRDVLHVGEIWYGGLFAVLGTVATLVGWFGTGLIRGMTDLQVRAVTLAVPGFVWLVAAAVPSIWVMVGLFASVGATAVLGAITVSSAYQRLAPQGSLGRIVSIVRLLNYGGAGIGSLVGGWVAAGWGLTAPLIIAGGVQVATAAAIAVGWPRRRGQGAHANAPTQTPVGPGHSA